MSNAPNTVADQHWHKRGSSRNTDTLIFVTMRGFPSVLYVMLVCCVGPTLCVCIVHIAGKAPLFCSHVICA